LCQTGKECAGKKGEKLPKWLTVRKGGGGGIGGKKSSSISSGVVEEEKERGLLSEKKAKKKVKYLGEGGTTLHEEIQRSVSS